MPTYEYAAVSSGRSCGRCRAGFDVKQSMSEPPLAACPECRAPVRRVIGPVAISTNRPSRNMLSDKNLREKGFKKLVNEGDGQFRSVV